MVDSLHPFSAGDRAKLRAAIDAARAGTAAKFEFAAVPASDHYTLVPLVWAALVALVATGALALARPGLGIGWGFAANAVLFVVLTFAFDWWPVRVRLVPREFKRTASTRMAHRLYANNLMSKDQEHNGVMLFVSLAERHLEIIAEREAHARVPAGTWDRIVAEATAAARQRGEVEGVMAAIAACGQALAAVFPPTPR